MKNTNKNMVQQGDVLMLKLSSLPAGAAKTISKQRCILAHGESGHSHVVDDDGAKLMRIGERMLLKVTKNATVVHEEHKPITLKAGIWEIGQVVEKDWLNGMVNPVRD